MQSKDVIFHSPIGVGFVVSPVTDLALIAVGTDMTTRMINASIPSIIHNGRFFF